MIYSPLLTFKYNPKEQKTVFIDLAITPPEGYYAQLMSKSGPHGTLRIRGEGWVIDPDFTGNIGVVLKNNSDQPIECLVGEQIAQLLFIKVASPILVQVTSLARTKWANMASGRIQTNKRIHSSSNEDCKC